MSSRAPNTGLRVAYYAGWTESRCATTFTTCLTGLPGEILEMVGNSCSCQKDLSALARTCRRLYSSLISQLYRNDERAGGSSALFWAIKNRRIDVLHLAASIGVSLHIPKLLHAAAKTNNVELLEIVAEGASRSYVSDGGLPARMPPLMESCFAANVEAVRVLLRHCPNLNISHRGRTALHAAVQIGNETIAGLLMDNGADASPQGKHGMTPLHHAVWNGKSDMVKLLLEQGADPNVTDIHNQTPLHFCAFSSHADIAQLLLDFGADTTVLAHGGHSAYTYALQREMANVANVAKVLREWTDSR